MRTSFFAVLNPFTPMQIVRNRPVILIALLLSASISAAAQPSAAMDLPAVTPWFLRWPALAVYLLLLAGLAYMLVWMQQLKLKRQERNHRSEEENAPNRPEKKPVSEVEQREQAQLRADNNKLKQQLRNKTVELAAKAKADDEKNRILLAIKEKFDSLQKEPALTKLRISEIQRILDAYISTGVNTFEIQIDELHQEFYQKLKQQFKGLSANDLRLCAYIKIGLNSKEIAEILNIQPSSAFISRSRLRKKLNLAPEEDLYGFLSKV